jgi:hypothetical protein
VATNQRLRSQFGVRLIKNGWRFTVDEWLEYVSHKGQLLGYRASLAEAFGNYAPGTFDLYGVGWDSSLDTRGVWRREPTGNALELAGMYRFCLAIENHEGEDSLISERVWDALYGDAVPVYRGNKCLHRYLPTGCFIDATSYGSVAELLEALVRMTQEEWEYHHAAGREFLYGDQSRTFLPASAAQDLISPILHCLGHADDARTAEGGYSTKPVPEQ